MGAAASSLLSLPQSSSSAASSAPTPKRPPLDQPGTARSPLAPGSIPAATPVLLLARRHKLRRRLLLVRLRLAHDPDAAHRDERPRRAVPPDG